MLAGSSHERPRSCILLDCNAAIGRHSNAMTETWSKNLLEPEIVNVTIYPYVTAMHQRHMGSLFFWRPHKPTG